MLAHAISHFFVSGCCRVTRNQCPAAFVVKGEKSIARYFHAMVEPVGVQPEPESACPRFAQVVSVPQICSSMIWQHGA